MSARNTKRGSRQREVGDLTDWERLRTMTEEEIEAGAASDPDNPRGLGRTSSAPASCTLDRLASR